MNALETLIELKRLQHEIDTFEILRNEITQSSWGNELDIDTTEAFVNATKSIELNQDKIRCLILGLPIDKKVSHENAIEV